MAEASYSTTTRVPVGALWAFVEDMDNWARFVTGYQAHEKRSDTESLWTLKGDLGVMSRTLSFEVRITEWAVPSRVAFTLAGLNEPMAGEGAFTIEADGAPAPAAAAPAPRKGLFARLFEAIARWSLALVGGRAERAAAPAPEAGVALSRMSFRLRIDPGGPMAPMINAMIKPLLLPAAEQLADKILAHLEGRAGEGREAAAEEGAPR